MYLFASMVVMFMSIGQMLRRAAGANDDGLPSNTGLRFASATLPAILVAVPILTTFLSGWQMSEGNGVTPRDGTLSVLAAFIGGLAVVAVAIVRLIRQRHQMGFWSIGGAVAAVLSGGVIVVATASHLIFTSSPDSGMVNMGSIDQVANAGVVDHPIEDVECASPILLTRWNGSPDTPVSYRCPDYLLNPYAFSPFAPWPGYTSGQSEDLAIVLHALRQNAKSVSGEAAPTADEDR